MPNLDDDLTISDLDLDLVTGGAKQDLASIRAQAAPYCPATVAKYGNLDPASITRSKAQSMGSECLTEMGPFKASFAKSRIDSAIDEAFPRK